MCDAQAAANAGIKAYHCLWGADVKEKEQMLADSEHIARTRAYAHNKIRCTGFCSVFIIINSKNYVFSPFFITFQLDAYEALFDLLLQL